MKGTDAAGLVGLLLMLLLGLPALLVSAATLMPRYVERAGAVMRGRPGRSFLLGLINAIFFLALSLLVGVPPLAWIGAFFLVIMLPLLAVIGLLVAAGVVGKQVWRQLKSRSATLPGSLVLGTWVLVPALLVPVVGWLFLLVITLMGLGAAIGALVWREEPAAAEPTV